MGAEDWRHDIRAKTTAFFLDVDGTLLDFKDRPEDVVSDEELRSLLRRLQGAAQGALALVSGRMLADIDRIVAPLVLPAAGTHGAELRFADGHLDVVSGGALDALRPVLEAFVGARPGLMMEDKGAAIALHYRHAAGRKDELAAFLDHAVSSDELMVQHGKMVAEVKSSRSSKGAAIERLMTSAPFAGRMPLFIGDDLTDEHGFEAVNKMGGVSIKVGPDDRTAARHRLADPADVTAFLAALCRTAERL